MAKVCYRSTISLLVGILLLHIGCKSSETTVVDEEPVMQGMASDNPIEEADSVKVTAIKLHGIPVSNSSFLSDGSFDEVRVQQNFTTSISPNILYSGINGLTIQNDNGISSIAVRSADAGQKSWSVEGDGVVYDCPTEHEVRIRIDDVTQHMRLLFEVVDCNQQENAEWLDVNNRTWTLDRVEFPDIRVGEKACRNFRIAVGMGNILESISFPENLPVEIATDIKFPVNISTGSTFHYSVCFTGDKPGTYIFPVTTWIRREYPAGGYTTYPVADTAVVRVVK